MGKKKWYVVIVGKEVGVFETWSEAASLISGVPGALHQSFPTEEEATRIFMQERDKGNTKVVGGRSPKVKAPSPMPASPVQAKNRTVSSGGSSPRLLEAPQSRRSPQPASPVRERALHPMTYTQGPSSSPNSSPCAPLRAFPRVEVRTPPDLAHYPSDDEHTPSSPTPSFQDKISKMQRSPKPKASPALSSKSGLPGITLHSSPILSPLHSPRFYTPENESLSLPTRPSSANDSPIYSWDRSQCLPTCPNYQHVSAYATEPIPFGFSQNSQISRQASAPGPLYDPRSPMMNLNCLSFERPSPAMKVERQLSGLFTSA